MKGWVGIDVAKDTITVTFLAADADTEHTAQTDTFSLTQEGWEDFHRHLHAFAHTLQTVAIGLESSGPYTVLLLAHLVTLPYPLYLINPTLIQCFRQAQSLRPAKTDPIDALIIARFLRQTHTTLTPFSETEDLHLLTREYESLSQQIAAFKTSIRQQVHILFPELPQHINLFAQRTLHLLLAFPSAQSVAQADSDTLHTLWQAPRGRKPRLTITQLQHLARTSFGVHYPTREHLLQSLIRRLLFLEAERKRLEQAILAYIQRLHQDAFRQLQQIPGMGPITTATLLAEIGDISRFPSAKHLVAYAGLDPSVHQSGRYRGRSRLSKRGSPHLRRILFLIAQHLVRTTRRFATAYHHYRQKGRSYKETLVIVARKILVVFYALLSRSVPFKDLPIPESP